MLMKLLNLFSIEIGHLTPFANPHLKSAFKPLSILIFKNVGLPAATL